MTTRVASCSCGQLRVTCSGEPERVSICHSLECQKRTGSVFAAQARFSRDAARIEGDSAQWTRRGDEAAGAAFHFCPTCGATLYWAPQDYPDLIYVATGAFADPNFPPPQVSVYEDRQHPWTTSIGALEMERYT